MSIREIDRMGKMIQQKKESSGASISVNPDPEALHDFLSESRGGEIHFTRYEIHFF